MLFYVIIIYEDKGNQMKLWIVNNLIVGGKLVSKRCNREWFVKNGFEDRYDSIIAATEFLMVPTFPQRIWHILNGVFEVSKCQNPLCNNSPTFVTFTKGYLRTCSSRCAQLDDQTINKIKDTNRKKYGVDYGLSSKVIIEKRKSTCVKNYGVDNPTKSNVVLNKIKKTNREKYGINWILEDQQKKEAAVVEKYGVKNIQQSNEVKLKTTRTRRSLFYDSLFLSDRLNGKVSPMFSKEEYVAAGYYSSFLFRCSVCNTEFLDCLEDGDVPRCTSCYKQIQSRSIRMGKYEK